MRWWRKSWWRPRRTLGMVLLGIWLVATSLMPLVDIEFAWSGRILSLLAVAAGSLILLDW